MSDVMGPGAIRQVGYSGRREAQSARCGAPTDRSYFHTLAGIRGVAALFVVVFHLGLYFKPVRDPLGYAAVDLFFLLSGAVIDASYSDRLRRGMSVLSFAHIRLARLYPLYILGTIMMLVAAVVAPHGILFVDPAARFTIPTPGIMFVPAALLVPIFNSGVQYPLNPPAWSLFWEIAVNVLYAAILPFLNRKTLIMVIVAAGAPFFAVNYFGLDHLACTPPLGLARASFSFFLGVLLYRERAALQPPAWAVAWLPMLAMVIVCITLGWQNASPRIYLAAVFLVFPVTVWMALHAQPSRWSASIWDGLGDISYPIYAMHLPLAVFLLTIVGPVPSFPWVGPAFTGALVITAMILNRYYDRPLRQILAPRR